MDSPELEDSTPLLVFEVLHALVREAKALDSAVARLLRSDPGPSKNNADEPSTLPWQGGESFYRALEGKIDRGELTFSQATDMLRVILREVDYFGVLVQNLLGSVTSDQALTVNRRPVDLEGLINEVVDLFEHLASERRIDILTYIHDDAVLNIDRNLTRRMIVNLLDNAIKYSYAPPEAGGKRFVVVECRRHSVYGDMAISIKSYGVEIDPDEITTGYIFKYGARGKYANDRGRSGTGIGLAEAKRIAEAHRGELRINSERQKGNTFLTIVTAVLPKT